MIGGGHMNRIIQDIQTYQLPTYIDALLKQQDEQSFLVKEQNRTFLVISYPINLRKMLTQCLVGDESGIYLLNKHPEFDRAVLFIDYLEEVVNQYDVILKKIKKRSDHYKNEIDMSKRHFTSKDLFNMMHVLIRYEVAFLGLEEALSQIITTQDYFFYDNEEADRYIQVLSQIKLLNNENNMYKQLIDTMANVAESVTGNELNKTMKALTIITLSLSIPTLIASIYGMNIHLPFQDKPYLIHGLILSSTIITLLIGIGLLRRKR